MDLSIYVETLRRELAVAANAAGEEARALAERLTAPLESATRLVMFEVLSAAADEITREMAPGAVEVRLRGREPGFVVTPAPGEGDFEGIGGPSGRPPDTRPQSEAADDDGGNSRLNLRLPDNLKLRIEAAARQEGLSLNAWLIRAASSALDSDHGEGRFQRNPRGSQRYTGWVR